tara:strand:+ start:2197 stop:2427 length:231 start_codon:yes stop_codon:yes gene_type:complete
MKYKAGYIEHEGKWAVTAKAGKEYFPNSLTVYEDDAKRMAREYSMRWHYDQVGKLWKEGVDKGEFEKLDHWGDYVA